MTPLQIVFGLIPGAWRWGFALAVGALLLGAYHWIRVGAYQDGYAASEKVCEQQKAAQATANRLAAKRAYDELRAAAQKLIEKDKELANAQATFDEQADAAAGAGDHGLGVDSVRRLDAIR